MAILVLLLALGGCEGMGDEVPGGTKGAEPPAPVTIADVVQKAVPVELRTFGTVEPKAYVEVKSQVGGELVGVHFEEGQDVAAGDLLFTIDPRPAKAERRIAEANLARDRINAGNARAEATRQQALFDGKLVSQEQRDKAAAEADALEAVLRADEAAVQSARLRVEYSAIRSPIDGRTGELRVHQGNLVRANDVALVTINQVTPIRVAFSLPQQELPAVMGQVGGAASGAPLGVMALVPGDEGAPEPGTVTLVDNAVDRATGTIKLWAEFENARQRLWPGQLVNVVLTLRVQPDAIAVPTRAVQSGQKGAYVFVVRPDGTVEDRFIEAARTHGEETIVASGLSAGERVVTDGQLRLRPGSRVVERPNDKVGAAEP
jgi:multidrug efflux system membrane fusion protein